APGKHGDRPSVPGRRGAHHRWPLRRRQGARRWALHHQRARPRRRPRVGSQARAGDHPPDRGAAVPRGGRGLIAGGNALAASEIERVFREEYGRAVAVLVRVFGDIDMAEEAVQDAFTAAVQRWPTTGLPPSPAGWIITTARNRAIDRLRREASRDDRHAQAALLPARLRGVLAVVYLIFNEGYAASSGDRLVRGELCAEAIRLGRLLVQLVPDDAEVLGLLALMLLIESRRAARTTPDGDLVVLADQDRGRWDRDLIAEGQAIVRRCLERNLPGPYQIQAAISAVHSDAADASATDWWQILQLNNQLVSIDP